MFGCLRQATNCLSSVNADKIQDYKRHELQWRFNLFFCASIIAGAFSGLLAYAIAHMDGVAGYGGWR